MKIETIKIKNFKNLDQIDLSLKGQNVYVVGGNNKGKSSFIDACFCHIPEQPLKQGAHKGEIELNIGEYIINYKFTEKNQKAVLSIFTPDGTPQKTPATLLKDLFGIHDFNIEKFLEMSDSKQVDFIKELCGIDWTDVDAEYKKLFEERRFLNRQYDELEKKAENETFHFGIDSAVDTSAILDELKQANEKNNKIIGIENGIKQRDEMISKNIVEIERLNAIIKDLTAQNDKMSDEMTKGAEWLKKNPKIDVSAIEQKLAESEQINAKFNHNQKIGSIRNESKGVWKKIETIQKRLDEISELKKRELSNVDLPVDGLTFDDDRLYLNGIPFKSDQINTATKIFTGLKIQLHYLKNVRIMKFDGSLIDEKTMSEINDFAKKHNIQLFVELVDRSGGNLNFEIYE